MYKVKIILIGTRVEKNGEEPKNYWSYQWIDWDGVDELDSLLQEYLEIEQENLENDDIDATVEKIFADETVDITDGEYFCSNCECYFDDLDDNCCPFCGKKEYKKEDDNDSDISPERKIKKALDLILQYGGIDGGHHKQWVLDQVVRLLSPDYKRWVKEHNQGEDGPNTYEWDKGIAP